MTEKDIRLGKAFDDIHTVIHHHKLSNIEAIGMLDLIKFDIMADGRDALDDFTDIEIDDMHGDN